MKIMSNFKDVTSVLLRGRPHSSRESIAKVIRCLGEIVSREVAKMRGDLRPSDEDAVWEVVKNQPAFEDEMQNLLKDVDRMHVLYVYSRFLNSKAIGPPLVKAALQGHD